MPFLSIESNITELGPSGNNLGSLNYESISYPVKGHYNLVAYFGNGTITGGPNSKDVTILEENTGPQCNNCTGPASSSVSTAAPTLITSAPQAGSPTTTVTLAPPTLSQPTPVPSNSLSGGEIAGTVVGVLAALAIGGALVWFFLRGRRGGSGTREQIFHNTETEPEIGTAPTSQDKPRVASPRQLYGVLEPAEKDTSDRPETRPENISSELP